VYKNYREIAARRKLKAVDSARLSLALELQALTRKGLRRWTVCVALVLIGVFAGFAFWWSIVPRESAQDAHGVFGLTNGVGNPVATRYASAFQRDAWDEIIDATGWMRQRLTHIRIETGDAAAEVEARNQLKARLGDRRVEGNRLRAEGIEEQYVFTKTARLETVGLDSGRSGLELATQDRTWIRVTYPFKKEAVRDERGMPIRSLTVGLNVSPDGLVLKANLIGNMDIDWMTVSYDWRDGNPSK
jgi:hypothetical protein